MANDYQLLAEAYDQLSYVEFIKGIPTKDLLELYKEDLHVYHSGNRGDYSHSVADSNLMFMRNELLKRGISNDELRALNDEINAKAGNSENAEGAKLKNMTPEERESYEHELDKKEAYKKNLAGNSENAENKKPDISKR